MLKLTSETLKKGSEKSIVITKLTIKLKPDKELPLNSTFGSLFQGVIMEKTDHEYADYLHQSALHPYSQFIKPDGDCLIWTVNALNRTAAEKITGQLLSDNFTDVFIKHKDVSFHIVEKKTESRSYAELLDKYYLRGESCRYMTLNFLTQTSFKSNGRYIIMPDAEMILNNLVRRYDSVSETTEIYDDTLKEYINKHTSIVEYSLRSRKYAMEGVTIPSFTGWVRIKLGGNPEFISLCNMLMDFSQYSGTGIKTGMGMGACLITNTGGAI